MSKKKKILIGGAGFLVLMGIIGAFSDEPAPVAEPVAVVTPTAVPTITVTATPDPAIAAQREAEIKAQAEKAAKEKAAVQAQAQTEAKASEDELMLTALNILWDGSSKDDQNSMCLGMMLDENAMWESFNEGANDAVTRAQWKKFMDTKC